MCRETGLSFAIWTHPLFTGGFRNNSERVREAALDCGTVNVGVNELSLTFRTYDEPTRHHVVFQIQHGSHHWINNRYKRVFAFSQVDCVPAGLSRCFVPCLPECLLSPEGRFSRTIACAGDIPLRPSGKSSPTRFVTKNGARQSPKNPSKGALPG